MKKYLAIFAAISSASAQRRGARAGSPPPQTIASTAAVRRTMTRRLRQIRIKPPDPIQDEAANQQSEQRSQERSKQPDAPGVARLSFIHGDVSTQRGDNGDWVAAT